MSTAPVHVLKAPSHIAVVRTDRLGDMVLTLPMFVELRRRFPLAKLTLVTRRYVSPLIREVGEIDNVLFIDHETRSLVSLLRHRDIDTAFFPRPRLGEVWSALVAGISTRVGSAYRWYSPLFTHRVSEHRSDAAYHESEYNLRMISHAFGGESPIVKLISPRPGPRIIASPPLIIIHPGSGGSAKEWPAERFGELARRLYDEGAGRIVITGIKSEKAVCQVVSQMCPQAENRCGVDTLEAMIDQISQSSLMCSNSTGVLHIAASLSVPVLGFYPSTPAISAKRWGPISDKAIVLSSGAGDDMTSISVEQALVGALRLLRGIPRS